MSKQHKNSSTSKGSPVRREAPKRQSWSTMDNATKKLFMSVLIVMAGALMTVLPGWQVVGYVVVGVGLGWYVWLRLAPVLKARHSRPAPQAGGEDGSSE